jgi:TolB-like protein
MRITHLRFFMCLTLLFVAAPSLWAASQVVTEEVQVWARKAVEQEKSLKAAASPNTVAVLYFQNLTQQPELNPLQKGLTLMLMTDLSKIDTVSVVERVRLQALVEELKLGVSGLVDESTAPRVGNLLGATWLVGGSLLTGQSNPLRIKGNVLQVPTISVVGQPSTEGSLNELLRMEKEVLLEIVKFLKIEPTAKQKSQLAEPMSTNIDALLHFFRGIDESDLRNYEVAAGFYQKALALDPNLTPAREALDELVFLGLAGKGKKGVKFLRSLRDQTSLTDQLTPEYPTKRTIIKIPSRNVSPPE